MSNHLSSESMKKPPEGGGKSERTKLTISSVCDLGLSEKANPALQLGLSQSRRSIKLAGFEPSILARYSVFNGPECIRKHH